LSFIIFVLYLKVLKLRAYIVFALHLFFAASYLGQDIHFSQYNGSVLNQSPAFTGFFDGDYRVNAIYRSQWQSVPVKYSTFSVAGDMRVFPKKLINDCIGLGLMINSDKAGDASYGTNQVYFSGSYIHKPKKDSALLVSAGLSLGFNMLGFNYNKMNFDNQFDGLGYNQNLATGELFAQTSTFYLDFNFGLGAQYSFSQFTKLTYGFSFNHLTNPNITYQINVLSKLDSKISNYVNFTTRINPKYFVSGELLYAHQGKYNEIVPGANLGYVIDNFKNNTVSLGLYFRAKDALISRIGYTYKTTTSGISYDLNTSKFLAATNRRGAIEIYITHIFKKIVPFVAKKRVCPVFM